MQQFKLSALLFFCLVAFVQNAQAQATLSVQGTIQKSTGKAVDDGDYAITFKLYTSETGGTAIWSETQDPVEIIGGVYSVTLGSVNPLTVPFDQPYFLGISVGTGQEHTPRTALTAAPYALGISGAISTATVTTSAAAYTILPTDHVVFLDLAGSQTVTLPSAATFSKREIMLINKTSTAKTVSSYVDLAGAATTAIPANGMIELRSNGTEWRLATTFPPPSAAAAKAYVHCYASPSVISSSPTTIAWSAEEADTQNAFSSTTFTAPRTGIYRVTGTIMFVANNTNNGGSLQVRCGGTCSAGVNGFGIGAGSVPPSFGPRFGLNFGGDIAMTAGQTLFVRAMQGTGVNQTIENSSDTGFFITEL